jgi:cytochrome c-type biogenesis protein CcmH
MAFAAVGAGAVQPDEIMPDPVKEARARGLSRELRCMVCQNQSIDDSDASLAKDIRVLIRERIAKGESNSEVRDFLVSRYGDFILLKPPFKRETLLLWLSAPLTLALGGVAIALAARRGRTTTAALSAEEERRLAEIAQEGAADPR